MKRTEVVEKLITEGFSEKTLVKFNDNQLIQLASRILSEEDVMISKKDPQFQQKVDASKKQNKTIETYEELKGNQSKIDKNKNGKIDADDFAILNKEKKGEVKEEKEENKERMSVAVSELKKGDILVGSKLEVVSVSSGAKTPSGKSDVTVKNPKTGKTDTKLWGKHTKVGIFRHSDKKEDVNEADMGLTVKSAPKSTPLFGGALKKSSSPKKKSVPKKKEETNEEGEVDESLHGIMIGATKEKLKKDLGRDPEDHEVEKELGKFVDSWKKDNESKKGDDEKPKHKKKEDVDELLRFYDDDGNPIKNKKGEKDAVSTKDKNFKKKVNSKKCPECQKDTKDCECDHTHLDENKTIKNWIKGLVENKEFHSFTSKNEIMELIQTKLNESDTMVQHGPKVKKGHNGIPEFMSYDAIVSAEPTTKPKPTTKPGTKPGEKPKTPYNPGPKPNPKPKASFE
jgi:hypothetical protein